MVCIARYNTCSRAKSQRAYSQYLVGLLVGQTKEIPPRRALRLDSHVTNRCIVVFSLSASSMTDEPEKKLIRFGRAEVTRDGHSDIIPHRDSLNST